MSPIADLVARDARSRSSLQYLTIAAAAMPLVALLAVLYAGVLYDLLLYCWNNEAASQGLLIPPLTVYIAYLRRGLVTAEPARVDGSGILLVAFGAMVLLLGKLGAEFFLARLSFVFVVAGLLWTFWGLARLRAMMLPLLLLASMIPLPMTVHNSLSGPLRLFASTVAETMARWAGVTLYRDGNTIHLANLALGVDDGCSGLTSLSSILIAALLLAYTFGAPRLDRILIVVAAVPVAVLANVCRIAGTAILSDHNPAYALGYYHAFSGWVVFVVAVTCLYGIAKGVKLLHR